jgi:NAD+ synthase (glutamine-hydrolysing)
LRSSHCAVRGRSIICSWYSPYDCMEERVLTGMLRDTTDVVGDNIYRHGMLRITTVAPTLSMLDPAANAQRAIEICNAAHADHAGLVVFPELGITGYAIDDLLLQDALLDGAEAAIARIADASKAWLPVVLVGAPFRVNGCLYNCAFVIKNGQILGVVPKTYLPNYREFYEARHFRSGADAAVNSARFGECLVPFGTGLLFSASDYPDFVLHVEVCEDLWVPIPPSSHAALAGATVLANLSASNVTIGKSEYRHTLCRAQSGRCMAAYVYSAAGPGESTTDLAWDGHTMVYENGALLAESERFAPGGSAITADVDLELLRQERMRHGTFNDCSARNVSIRDFRQIDFKFGAPQRVHTDLKREINRFPFVPNDKAKLNEHCFEAYNIQVHGLKQRLAASGIQKIVIGVSGGLDSTQALLVAVRAMDAMGLPRTNILAYTLPAFATSEHTKSNAWRLMKALGVTAAEIDMTPASRQMLADIGHPYAGGTNVFDITFENVQAGARTSLLFRLANMHNAIVLGTGDLSELALGWCTYGVGDHMSHYNVNASVSKTLIQHLVRWVATGRTFDTQTGSILLDILNTEISPELVPGSGDKPAQKTEDFVGPFELQDFNLYYITRHGFKPSKIAFMASHAWGDKTKGHWPPGLSSEAHREYDALTIRKWLREFLRRFFATSQFKRSVMPNGPKVSPGGALSPRGDWRAPSDASATVWIAELDASSNPREI